MNVFQDKENKLIDVDHIFLRYAKENRIKLARNYRDTISRTLFWWEKGIVKLIQLKATKDRYELWIGAYKFPLPFLNFWTLYLDVPNDYSEKICDIKFPFIEKEVYNLLNEAKNKANLINKKSIKDETTMRAIIRNLLIPTNLLSLVIFIVILITVSYGLFRFSISLIKK